MKEIVKGSNSGLYEVLSNKFVNNFPIDFPGMQFVGGAYIGTYFCYCNQLNAAIDYF